MDIDSLISNIGRTRNKIAELNKKCNVFYVSSDIYELGLIQTKTPSGNKVKAYDIERCICDIIKNKKKTDPQIFIQGIKEYFSLKNHNYSKLIEYAKQFHIEEDIYMYMEVLT